MSLHPSLQCFLSNRTEVLCDRLAENLFACSHPFAKRLVIIPSAAMKSFVMFHMAQHGGIATGIDFGFLDPSIQRLCQLMTPDAESVHFPSSTELALSLESAIYGKKQKWTLLSSDEQLQWQSLFDYLGIDPSALSACRRSGKRITELCLRLASLFVDYGKYGAGVLEQWRKHSKGWQQLLWCEMEKAFNPWGYPYSYLESLPFDRGSRRSDVQVHLFGMSYLSPVHYRFFLRMSRLLPTYYYLLSPCQKFWSDLLSDKESAHLKHYWSCRGVAEEQQNALEDYLTDHNPLLANFGRLGREMAMQVEGSEAQVEEQYLLPRAVAEVQGYQELLCGEERLDPIDAPLTLLHALQSDIALLRNPTTTLPVVFIGYDRTVQVHAAPKPMREVEAVYDAILGIIDAHCDDSQPITPRDILVMAPDISVYSPFVQTVFESPDSMLPIHMMDLQAPSHYPVVQAFLHLLKLSFGHWDSLSFVRLLEYRCFSRCHGFSVEEVEQLIDWIKVADIRWGTTPAQRNEILELHHCQGGVDEGEWAGTWEHGLGRLLEGLIMMDEEGDVGDFCPLNPIDARHSVLLGVFVRLVRSLEKDLKFLSHQGGRTIQEWVSYLRVLYETYFSHEGDAKDEAGYLVLMKAVDELAKSAVTLKEVEYPFDTVHKHLVNLLNVETTSYRESSLQSVRFCSLLPMRAVPARVVVLMGMEEKTFPRKETNTSLNLLKGEDVDYAPSQTDFDRYLFLEALLSARDYFILSYTSQVAGDPHLQPPSLLVDELLSYLNRAYRCGERQLSEVCVFSHHLQPFHRSYFSDESSLKSFSKIYYRAAQAYYGKDKGVVSPFLSAFVSKDSEGVLGEELLITLSELNALARSPLKTYFNKTLGIYFRGDKEGKLQEGDDLLISPLQLASLVKSSVAGAADVVEAKAKLAGVLPHGPFKQVEVDRLRQEQAVVKTFLSAHGVVSEGVFSIEFSDKCETVEMAEKCWKTPPLKLMLPSGRCVKVAGTLEMVSRQGIIFMAKDSFEEAVKRWPQVLVFHQLIEAYDLPIAPRVFFVKGKGEAKAITFETKRLLQQFIAYFIDRKQSPSPLQPEWVSAFLCGAGEEVEQKFQQADDEYHKTFDEALNWLKRTSPETDMKSNVEVWQKTAEGLFVDMAQQWYPKSCERRRR